MVAVKAADCFLVADRYAVVASQLVAAVVGVENGQQHVGYATLVGGPVDRVCVRDEGESVLGVVGACAFLERREVAVKRCEGLGRWQGISVVCDVRACQAEVYGLPARYAGRAPDKIEILLDRSVHDVAVGVFDGLRVRVGRRGLRNHRDGLFVAELDGHDYLRCGSLEVHVKYLLRLVGVYHPPVDASVHQELFLLRIHTVGVIDGVGSGRGIVQVIPENVRCVRGKGLQLAETLGRGAFGSMRVVCRHVDVVGHSRFVSLLGPIAAQGLFSLVQETFGIIFVRIDNHSGIACTEVVFFKPIVAGRGGLQLYEYVKSAEKVLSELIPCRHFVVLDNARVGIFHLCGSFFAAQQMRAHGQVRIRSRILGKPLPVAPG